MNKTFFEDLGIADRERIHSQILAQIFSSDFSALTKRHKIKLLDKIFDIKNVVKF
jgi:hypothetical protein